MPEKRYPDVFRVERSTKFLSFRHKLPAVEEFPFEIWSRVAQKWHKNSPPDLPGYGEPDGFRPLREAIAVYLKSVRTVNCDYSQAIFTSGAQYALTLAAKTFLEPEDAKISGANLEREINRSLQ